MKTYKLSCDDGFSVKSSKKSEVIAYAKSHIRKEHHRNMKNSEISKMVR